MKEDVGDGRLVLVAQDVGGGAAAPPMRMSSGASKRSEKPRAALSSCIDETPMSSTTPSTASTPRRRATRRARRSAPPRAAAGRRTKRREPRRPRWPPDRGRARRPRAAIEKRARIAAGAERGVDIEAAGARARAPPSPPQAGQERGRARPGAASLIGASPGRQGLALGAQAPDPRPRLFEMGLEPRRLPDLEFVPLSTNTASPSSPRSPSAAPRKKPGPPRRAADLAHAE